MSERELLHTDRVLVVEGKYDAARLSHLTDAMILLTDGFGIYKDKKRQQLLKTLAKKNGLILFTDSDAAGFRIRTYITGLVGAYVLRMQILSTKSVGGMDVADKVHIQVFSTNDSLAPEARVFRQTTKNGLYNALDIGSIWLQKANETR